MTAFEGPLKTPSPTDSPAGMVAETGADADRRLFFDRYGLRILTLLRRMTRAEDLHSSRLRAQFHATAPQMLCLHALVSEGPMTLTALSRSVVLNASTVIGIVDRLEAKGWLRRERDRRDRRRVNLTATPEGEAMSRKAPLLMPDGLAQALERLPEEEIESFVALLERFAAMLFNEPLREAAS